MHFTMYIIILQVELLPDIQNAPRILPPYVQFIPANFKKVQYGSFTFTLTSNIYNFGPKTFLPTPFSYNYPSHSFLCLQISIHCFVIELQYNHVLTL